VWIIERRSLAMTTALPRSISSVIAALDGIARRHIAIRLRRDRAELVIELNWGRPAA
jgi:hypothetical protein